jgi:hypothetical protein
MIHVVWMNTQEINFSFTFFFHEKEKKKKIPTNFLDDFSSRNV